MPLVVGSLALCLLGPPNAVAEFTLPDGRAWEMVSPLNKNGGQIEAIPAPGSGMIQASASGDAITYLATVPIGEHPEGNSSEFTQMLATRAPAGWKSIDLATPDSGIVGKTTGVGSEYRFFSTDLSLSLVEQLSVADEPPLLAGEAAERTIYVRNNTSGSYRPLVTPANTQPGTVIAPPEAFRDFAHTFVGATPGLNHVVLAAWEALTTNATKVSSGFGTLYEWTNGGLRLVSVLPDEKQALPTGGGPGPFLGDETFGNVRNAISEDGTRIAWGDEEGAEGRRLYLSDMTTGRTVQLDAAEGVAEPTEHEAVFQLASADGSRVFFTDGQKLTSNSTAGGRGRPDLYVCEMHEEAGGLACRLKDLTVDQNAGESAQVRGAPEGEDSGTVIGASGNGASVFFLARGVLTSTANGEEEAAKAGQNNLYMAQYDGETGEWKRRFITTLAEEDVGDWGGDRGLVALTAGVSPNGEYLAFMSDRELTGYDNTDANSVKSDEEVFLYSAAANHIACISCDPSGARPVGMLDRGVVGPIEAPLVDRGEAWAGHWLAGSVPAWASLTATNARYQPRFLSNSGRVFFDGTDDLTTQAINHQEDVYEYEPAGVGGCSAATETFSERSQGCVGLLSAGTSTEESAVVDAGESGDDVFFVTAAQLVAQDVDHSFDLYDAHVCSQVAPCFPPAIGQSPGCSEGASCRGGSPPSALAGPPASVTFSGPGNIAQRPSKPAATPRTVTRARKLAAALRACRREPKRKRAKCNARARAKYAKYAKYGLNRASAEKQRAAASLSKGGG